MSYDDRSRARFLFGRGVAGDCKLSWPKPGGVEGSFTIAIQAPGPFKFETTPVTIETGADNETK